jgi:phenylalanyl-tRNA synthetase beta chain
MGFSFCLTLQKSIFYSPLIYMLFLKSWLADYINLDDYTDQQISDILSLNSGECEEINVISDYFDGKVVVGEIRNLYKHPDADKLNVFDVYLGEEFKSKHGHDKVQIVSAASNARDGLICPVALDGAKLPYMTILGKKMRGLESMGMCCGLSELALETEYSAGLWELNDLLQNSPYLGEGTARFPCDILSEGGGSEADGGSIQLGVSICKVLPQYFPTQTTFEIKYLQDRLSTCANHLGLAIEIAICLQKPELLKGIAKSVYYKEDFVAPVLESIQKSETQISLKDNTDSINVYNIFDLELPTTYHLNYEYQMRMFLTGKNLIGGLADLSNYMLFDFGQPNHFFSAAKIENYDWKFDKLTADTKFQGLGQFKDGVLPKGLTVMQNSKDQILIVPGITGSTATKTDESETKVLLEITNFDKEMVARNSFAMNYRSDSAKTFSSGVSKYLQLLFLYQLKTALPNAKLTHSLLWNAGETYDNIADWYKGAFALDLEEQTTIIVDLEYIADRLDDRGVDYWQDIILEKLRLLGNVNKMSKQDLANKYEKDSGGFQLEEDDILDVEFYVLSINPYYSKIESQEDVLFEVAKLIGLDNLQPEYLTFSTESKTPDYYNTLNNLRGIFTKFGFSEILTRPFLPKKYLLSSLTNTEQVALEALSSQRADEPFLRDSLFAQNMQTVAKNIKLGLKDPKVFELTRIYTHHINNLEEVEGGKLPLEKKWELGLVPSVASPRQEGLAAQADWGYKVDVFAKHIDAGNTLETWTLSATAITEDPYSLTSLIHEVANKFNLEVSLQPKAEVGKLPLSGAGTKGDWGNQSDGVDLGQTITYSINSNNHPQFIVKLTEVANTFKKTFDIPINKKVWFIDFTFDPEVLEYKPYNTFSDVSDYPTITRSYSYIVPKICQWSVVADIINAVNLNYTKQELIIKFQPTERMPKDENTEILNFEVEFSSNSRTLKNEEIEAWSSEVFGKIKEMFGDVEMR